MESDSAPRPDFLSQDELWQLHAHRRYVLKNPKIFFPKIPDELTVPEVKRIGKKMGHTVERWRGRMPEVDMPGLSRLYERRGVRNLGSLMLRHGDIVTPESCLEYLQEMEQGRFNVNRDHELLLRFELSRHRKRNVS
jgi:hypothetical protein